MSRLKELLEQESLVNDIDALVSTFKRSSRVSKLMDPSLIECNVEEQSISIEFPVLECQLNEHDTMHAGFIAAAFDEALGIFAAYLGAGRATVSINISLNYLKPIPMEDSIRVTVKVTSLGKKLITMSGECHLKSNSLLTNTALATFAIVG
ncbi:hypothetical protein MASR2M70_17920 [Bacillota bacterium]